MNIKTISIIILSILGLGMLYLIYLTVITDNELDYYLENNNICDNKKTFLELCGETYNDNTCLERLNYNIVFYNCEKWRIEDHRSELRTKQSEESEIK